MKTIWLNGLVFAARWLIAFLLSPLPEIEKVQKDEGKEEEKFIDVVINKNMKLGQKVLIPVKQFPKVSAIVPPPRDFSPKNVMCRDREF